MEATKNWRLWQRGWEQAQCTGGREFCLINLNAHPKHRPIKTWWRKESERGGGNSLFLSLLLDFLCAHDLSASFWFIEQETAYEEEAGTRSEGSGEIQGISHRGETPLPSAALQWTVLSSLKSSPARWKKTEDKRNLLRLGWAQLGWNLSLLLRAVS